MAKQKEEVNEKPKRVRRVRKVTAAEQPQVETPQQEIDLVVPMVFPSDPVWVDSLKRTREEMHRFDSEDEKSKRFRSWGLERLMIQAALKAMPWIRRVHILLSGETQRQAWMDKLGDNVVVHYHADFMPHDVLPTFSPMAIELYLHRIPDLADRFIYANDDMFAVGKLKPTDFFTEDGKAVWMPDIELNKRNAFHRMCNKGLQLAAKDAGKELFSDKYVWLTGHGFSPLLKATIEDVWSRQAKELTEASLRFRDSESLNQYLWLYCQTLRGECVKDRHNIVFLTTTASEKDVQRAFDAKTAKVVCVNDLGDGNHKNVSLWIADALSVNP